MAGFGTVDLASAVCAAGGFGSIGCGVMEPRGRSQNGPRTAQADGQAD